MSHPNPKLSPQSIAILEQIAFGKTYEQILSAHPDLTYLDIFHAAEEALRIALIPSETPRPTYTLAQKRERYPRAYEKWSDAEDANLQEQIQTGATVARIATQLQRNRGEIRKRILKLNLISQLTPKEQTRLNRLIERKIKK